MHLLLYHPRKMQDYKYTNVGEGSLVIKDPFRNEDKKQGKLAHKQPHSTWLRFGHRLIIPSDVKKGAVC